MNIEIKAGSASGKVKAPPSKSMAHRMLIGAGLSGGTSVVRNIDLSEDIKATIGILEALGVRCDMKDRQVTVRGIGKRPIVSELPLDCNESGSTLRFFIPLLLSGGAKCEFIGAKRLFERPLSIYEEICREQGISFEKSEGRLKLNGRLQASYFQVPGDISSQFITGLLYALPLLEKDSVLEILPPIESKAYIEMTLQVLHLCGIEVKQEGNRYEIKGSQIYQPIDVNVEGDYSNAAFLEAFNLIGGKVQVDGLAEDSLQGDQIYRIYFKLLQEEKPRLDIAECPDLGPILMGMAAALHGAVFTGTRRLKMKESDRGVVMAEELAKFGIRCEVQENEITVYGGELRTPKEELLSHNDHRIAMTLSVLASITGGVICEAQAVKKSFPNYYDVISDLGIQIEKQ